MIIQILNSIFYASILFLIAVVAMLLYAAASAGLAYLIKPIFDSFERVISFLRTAFQNGVDAIKGVWDTLVEALKKALGGYD